ncbi:MAG TPA: hypothetical protein PKA10_00160 [Selenomonadales bacterium]|nr:hypothetical protein [Selenomonadales bacterium]
MDGKQLREALRERLATAGRFAILSGEEYFFLLGQVLVAVLARLGGVDKYRREFSYLTNPSVRKTVGELGLRSLRFLEGVRGRARIDERLARAYDEVLSPDYQYSRQDGAPPQWEEAFYEGLYSENMFAD